MTRLEDDMELDSTARRLDELLDAGTPLDDEEVIKLSDLIEEYETRTDILNRNFRI